MVIAIGLRRARRGSGNWFSIPGRRPAPAGAPPEMETKTVTVEAEGYNRDDAIKQALRKALEEGAGAQIASFSQTQDFVLVRDTIYSRASGIVSDFRILSEREGPGGTSIVRLEARVRPSAVAAAWGEVQNVLDQIGRPKIMVWIDERIDGELQEDSMVENRIEELFVKSGFDLVTRKARGAAPLPEAADVRDERGATELQRIAREAGAHILIRGSANADRAGLESLYGVPAAFYNCDVQARIYATDTGRLLVSESIPSTRRGVRSRHEFSPQAARELVQATFPPAESAGRRPALAIKLYESVMEQWSTQISFGGDIELEVRLLDFRSYLKLKQALAGIENVRSVEGISLTTVGSSGSRRPSRADVGGIADGQAVLGLAGSNGPEAEPDSGEERGGMRESDGSGRRIVPRRNQPGRVIR